MTKPWSGVLLVFLNMWCTFFLSYLNACAVFNCINTMLVTFHAIWYVITELSCPAWQKDLRDITFYVIQAMEEAKKY